MKEQTAQALEDILDSLDMKTPLDVAFAEVQSLKLLQPKVEIELPNGQLEHIDPGLKFVPDLEKIGKLDPKSKFCFAGKIRSAIVEGGNYTYVNKLCTGWGLS